MSNLPMMPWFPSDFAGSTSGWTFGERALYRSLLDAQWILGSLPSDVGRLARIAGMSTSDELALFEMAWQTVQEKFEPAGRGKLANKRLEEHRVKAVRLVEQRRTASEASAQARRERALDRSDTERSTARQPNAEHPSPSPSVRREEKKTPPSGGSKESASPAAPLPADEIDELMVEKVTAMLEKPTRDGKRLPDDFTLTPTRRGIALSEKIDPERTFLAFRDYWTAAAGQRSRKRDWDAAWRTWCRTEADRRKLTNGGPAPRKTLYEQLFTETDDGQEETQPTV